MTVAQTTLTYTNPVYSQYFADPFVLKVGEEYYAYGTAPPDTMGRQFPVLRSDDLVHWEHAGHALEPIHGAFNYWAPEVAEKDGRFYLYYSASMRASDEHHRLRVAIADHPQGPFRDSGKELLPNAGFSIDAHPFRDPQTGQWFLYFATDYVEDEPHGTGLAAVPLADDMVTPLAQKPTIVLRASCVWQVYEKERNYKGRVWPSWHCIEGPFVLYQEGKYHCLYSGGAWHTENYGVGFATADNPLGPWKDDWAEHGPMVLRGQPGVVVGPGHNSVVLGPDNQTLFLVYHAWDRNHTARRMCIDPMRWTSDGPRCDGPSSGVRTVRF
jgi:arabinan endo-1,5-alpha-L-arabinosidase